MLNCSEELVMRSILCLSLALFSLFLGSSIPAGAQTAEKAAAPAQLPDLIVTAITQQGGNLLVTVKNQGTALAGRNVLRVKVMTLDNVSPPVIRETTVPLLAPGRNKTIRVALPLIQTNRGTQVTATVNATRTIVESNLKNNTLTKDFIIG
jgi:hypothetical protein